MTDPVHVMYEELRAALGSPEGWEHEQCIEHAKACNTDRVLLDFAEYSINEWEIYDIPQNPVAQRVRMWLAEQTDPVYGESLRDVLRLAAKV